jgi:hypothetical protein
MLSSKNLFVFPSFWESTTGIEKSPILKLLAFAFNLTINLIKEHINYITKYILKER